MLALCLTLAAIGLSRSASRIDRPMRAGPASPLAYETQRLVHLVF